MFTYIKTIPERLVRWHQRRKFKNSSEPWVSIIGDVEDAKKGLKLDLDWNDAFITYLRQNGIMGIKDEEVVARWVTTLHAQLLDEGDEE
jgi:hypothetical protein